MRVRENIFRISWFFFLVRLDRARQLWQEW